MDEIFVKPKYKFLIWDVLGMSGYMTAGTIEEALRKADRMLGTMRAVTLFEIRKTKEGYLTHEILSLHRHKGATFCKIGTGKAGLHAAWYERAYRRLDIREPRKGEVQ